MSRNILSLKEIYEIYNNFVAINYTEEYAHRYADLPLEKNNKNWKWEGKDFPRVIAVLEFEKFITENSLSFDKALCINGSDDPEYEYVNCKEKVSVHYETDPINNDLHRLNLRDRDFDFAMINQTIEHLYDPIACLQNLYDHLKKGGILYTNLPANNIPHSEPIHYYTGVTPVGLGAMLKLAGFDILQIGQWGTFEFLSKIFESQSWPDYTQLTTFSNEPKNPAIVWAFAIKR